MTEEADPKQLATSLVTKSWEDAIAGGVSADLFASTCLSAALASLIELHGADAVARMMDRFADGVRAGKFAQPTND